MSKKREPKKDWVVRMKSTIIQEVCVENCTEEEARSDPWSHANGSVEPQEIEAIDHEVISVEPNE